METKTCYECKREIPEIWMIPFRTAWAMKEGDGELSPRRGLYGKKSKEWADCGVCLDKEIPKGELNEIS